MIHYWDADVGGKNKKKKKKKLKKNWKICLSVGEVEVYQKHQI